MGFVFLLTAGDRRRDNRQHHGRPWAWGAEDVGGVQGALLDGLFVHWLCWLGDAFVKKTKAAVSTSTASARVHTCCLYVVLILERRKTCRQVFTSLASGRWCYID